VAKNCVPNEGYLCLESEDGEAHFRDLKIKELPGGSPASPSAPAAH